MEIDHFHRNFEKFVDEEEIRVVKVKCGMENVLRCKNRQLQNPKFFDKIINDIHKIIGLKFLKFF